MGFDRNWDQDPNDPDTPVATSSNPWEEPTAAPSQRQNSEGSGPSATDRGTEAEEEGVAAENAQTQETRVADRALSEMGPPPKKTAPTTIPAELINAGQPETFPAPQAPPKPMPAKGVPSKGRALPVETYQRANPPSAAAAKSLFFVPAEAPAPQLELTPIPLPIAPEAPPPPQRRVVGRIGLTTEELTYFRTELQPALNLERVRQDYARRGLEHVTDEERQADRDRFLEAREEFRAMRRTAAERRTVFDI